MISKQLKFLSLTILFMLLLIGCSGKTGSGGENPKKTEENSYEGIVTAAGEFPIVEEEVTLDILVVQDPLVTDFETNEFTKWYEEETGVKVKWEVIPQEGVKEKINLILTSGDYPDVIMGRTGISRAQLRAYGNKGVFLDLVDLIDEYGIETKGLFDQEPIVESAITTPEGNIYGLPLVSACYHCTIPNKMWIYRPWLDELGLDMPTTTDEFYRVLKAFKTEDPNGNGKADEIPYAGYEGSDGFHFLMNPFIYSQMYVKDGIVEAPWDKPEWKEGLEYLSKMYDEGLIYSGTYTQSDEQLKELGENPEDAILGSAEALAPLMFTNVNDLSEGTRYSGFEAVPPLEGPNGNQVAVQHSIAIIPSMFIITNKAKHPDVAFRFADAIYNEDITRRAVIGREGKEWEYAGEGDIGLDGEPAIIKTLDMVTEGGLSENVSWYNTGPTYQSTEFRSTQAYPLGHLEKVLWDATEKYEPYTSDTIELVENLFFSEEQTERIAHLENTIENYVLEMEAKFVTGDINIEKDWDEYIKTLDNIGLKEYIEIHQEAYDLSN